MPSNKCSCIGITATFSKDCLAASIADLGGPNGFSLDANFTISDSPNDHVELLILAFPLYTVIALLYVLVLMPYDVDFALIKLPNLVWFIPKIYDFERLICGQKQGF